MGSHPLISPRKGPACFSDTVHGVFMYVFYLQHVAGFFSGFKDHGNNKLEYCMEGGCTWYPINV